MKIKTRLTVIYTLIFAGILICLNLYIYYIYRSLIFENFFIQLKDRAVTSATVFLETDEPQRESIDRYWNKYEGALPKEIIRIYNDKNQPANIDSVGNFIFEESFINQIKKENEVRRFDNDRQTTGILYKDNDGQYVVIASAVNETGLHSLSVLFNILMIGFVISIIIVIITGQYFTKLILSPISSISAQAKKISESNLHLRLDEGNKKDELAELSITINGMLSRLGNAFIAQRSFVSNASHEIRNPLTSIMGNVEIALTRDRKAEEYRDVLESIAKDADKLYNMTNGLLKLANSNLTFSNLEIEEVRLDELLLEVVNEIRIKRPACSIKVVFPQMPANPLLLSVEGNKNLLHIALQNVIDNACKFSGDNEVKVSLLLNDGQISFLIEDKGIGIETEALKRIRETFYRAPNARNYSGSGIGLSLTDKIINLHGGKMEFKSELNKGTTVSIEFKMTGHGLEF
jgi:signal transduction histidine kinase